MSLTTEEKKTQLHSSIDQLTRESVDVLLPLVPEFTNTGKSPVQQIFLVRAIRALLRLTEEVSLEEATAAPTDYDLLLALLQMPEVIQVLPSRDPLAEARIRGLIAKQELLQVEGGVVSSEEAGQILGIKRQAVDKRRLSGKLIALPAGRAYVYPVWQFIPGKTLPGLEKVLQCLQVRDPWMQAAWMINSNSRLNERSPLELLREGNLEVVIDAAKIYGEQGAA